MTLLWQWQIVVHKMSLHHHVHSKKRHYSLLLDKAEL